MKNCIAVAILAALVLAVGIGWLIWPRHPKDPSFRLKIVRQAVEHGTNVVFFRVEGDRQMLLTGAVKVVGDVELEPIGIDRFWAHSRIWPMGDPRKVRKEFPVLAPTNASVWKLRVTFYWDNPNDPGPVQRIKTLPTMWRSARSAGWPLFTACSYAWNAFYAKNFGVIESNLITNSVPQVKGEK